MNLFANRSAARGVFRFPGFDRFRPVLEAAPPSRLLATALLFVLPLCQSAWAQGLDPHKKLSQYTLKSWSDSGGFPGSGVLDAAQTRDGYLWFATYQGLVRYDGNEFRLYSNADWEELRSASIRRLCVDPDGGLWIGGQSGLFFFKNGSFAAYTTKDGLSSDHIVDLDIDSQGRLWVATLRALNIFDRKSFTLQRQEMPSLQVMDVLASREGHVWVGTASHGLFRFRENGGVDRFTTSQGLPGNSVYSLAEDREGRLWMGVGGAGLCRFEDGTFSVVGESSKNQSLQTIFDLVVDSKDTVWLGTRDGLLRWREGVFSRLGQSDGLTHDQVSALCQDHEGSLWIGTYYGGLNQLRDGKFMNYGTPEGLSSDTVHAVYHDRDGSVWIATTRGLNRFQDGVFTVWSADGGQLPEDTVRDVLRDSRGDLWIATYGGLVRQREGRFRTFTTRDGLQSDAVRVLLRDSSGNLWIGSRSGLNRYRDGRLEKVVIEKGLTKDLIMSIFEDRDGSLWFGTSGGGLLRFKNGEWRRLTEADGLASNVVFRLLEDDRGDLWIGTTGGLNRLKDGKLSMVGARNGLPSQTVLQVLEDRLGAFWITTGAGVLRVAKEDLRKVASGGGRLQGQLFGRGDGLRGDVTSTGQSNQADDGTIWLPTLGGVAVLNPARIPINVAVPPVQVHHMVADGRTYYPTPQTVELPPLTRKLEFHYAVLSFAAPERTGVKYKLEGYDDQWFDPGARRAAYYTNLDPGRYQFKVLASNNDGIWNPDGASLAFHLQPAFHQTGWFYALTALAVLALGTTVYLLRVNRLKRRNRELEETVRARTREIREKNEENERLLLNILPAPIAERLKRGEETIADDFGDVTVLFADLVGFTELASRTDSKTLVALLNLLFSEFDALAVDYGVEKIKTIGDSYMAVAGLPTPSPNHARAAAEMALDMMEAVDRLNRQKGISLQLRVGLNSGPVVAGVIGTHKFVYDLWGDTVNVASRMESHGLPGHIHVSTRSHASLQHYYDFRPRGRVNVKGKGFMQTYLLIRRKGDSATRRGQQEAAL